MLYMTHQNSARNAAFSQGLKDGFRWMLIFDGNGFVSNGQWQGIRGAIAEAESQGQKVLIVPMVRMHEPATPAKLNASTPMRDVLQASPRLAEPQIGFRADLLPPGLMPYNENLKYGMMNKMDLLDLCGGLHVSQFNNASKKKFGSFWTKKMCHCGKYIHGRFVEREFLESSRLDISADLRAAANARAFHTNTNVSKKCGLWLRLWPWPDDNALDFVEDGGLWHAGQAKTHHCKSVGVESLVDSIRCRASARREGHIRFRNRLRGICRRAAARPHPLALAPSTAIAVVT